MLVIAAVATGLAAVAGIAAFLLAPGADRGQSAETAEGTQAAEAADPGSEPSRD